MAKFLRVISNLLLICYIAAALALFVPPLVGVVTTVTLEGTAGNQELGSVNYAWRTPLRTIEAGDEILVTEPDSVMVYTVASVDTEQSVVTAADPEASQIAVRSYVYKLMLTVPYLGYIAIAMQTMEGMIVLAATAAVLLLLCIFTAIWCRKRKIKRMKEDEEDLLDEEDNEFFQNLAAQKREADARAEAAFRARRDAGDTGKAENAQPALDEEYEELPAAGDTELKTDLQEAFDEEDADSDVELSGISSALEEVLEETETAEDSETETMEEQEASEVKEETALSEEKAEADPADGGLEIEESEDESELERVVGTGNIPGVQAALEAALNTQQIQRHVRRNNIVREPEVEQEELPPEEIELAMPVYTVDEYLQKAYAAGQDPVVVKDELTGVTYIDYSECI
ncbi:MAG: hypothetical protein Q4B85_00285 [Lachnospiraceae bacterium]|nr:hypothetical protein [Lachnospiraceae bacterium]